MHASRDAKNIVGNILLDTKANPILFAKEEGKGPQKPKPEVEVEAGAGAGAGLEKDKYR
ncbi:hypothetical protein OAG24_00780 [bacterium]|nr:hypothetical protein [bacterium]